MKSLEQELREAKLIIEKYAKEIASYIGSDDAEYCYKIAYDIVHSLYWEAYRTGQMVIFTQEIDEQI